MKKVIAIMILLPLILFTMNIAIASTTTIFEDGFEDGVRFTNWDYFSTGWLNSNTACGAEGGVYAGSYSACTENGGDSYMEQFNTGWANNVTAMRTHNDCFVNFSYWVDSSLDNGEFFWFYVHTDGGYITPLEISNGGGDDSTWHVYSWNATAYMFDTDFEFGFEGYNNDAGEEIVVDNVGIYCYDADVPTDTCTYTSGNWEIDLADECVISTDTDIGANSITFTGTGSVTINATITAASIGMLPANQIGYITSNGWFWIG